jgi:hypothetical protein
MPIPFDLICNKMVDFGGDKAFLKETYKYMQAFQARTYAPLNKDIHSEAEPNAFLLKLWLEEYKHQQTAKESKHQRVHSTIKR